MASFYHTMFSFSELRTYDGWTTLFAWKCPFQKGISFQDWWVFIVAYWTAVAPLRSAFVDACPTGTLDRKHGQEFVAAALQDRCHSQPSGIWHMQWRVQAFLFGFVSSDRSKFVHIKLFQTARVFICHRYMTVQIKVYIYIYSRQEAQSRRHSTNPWGSCCAVSWKNQPGHHKGSQVLLLGSRTTSSF